ncbi:MAG: hypothetical protein WAV22_10985 [Porticoccaceae bacterium]
MSERPAIYRAGNVLHARFGKTLMLDGEDTSSTYSPRPAKIAEKPTPISTARSSKRAPSES